MAELPHLRIEGVPTPSRYVYAGPTPRGKRKFGLPGRPATHGSTLTTELNDAAAEAERLREGQVAIDTDPEGMVLTFTSDPNYKLRLESLERRRAGIQILSVSMKDGRQVAKVFVPHGQIAEFLNLLTEYATTVFLTFEVEADKMAAIEALEVEDNEISLVGRPLKVEGSQAKGRRFSMPESEVEPFKLRVGTLGKLIDTYRENNKLIESIASIRLAIVEDFWQDPRPFPALDTEIWWEVWLRSEKKLAAATHQKFMALADALKFTRVSDRYVAFPERIALHVFTSARRLSESIELLSMLSELRQGKEVASTFFDLEPRFQGELIKDAITRMKAAPPDSPCVSIMDSGVHRGHPLIEPHLPADDCHAVLDRWGHADDDPDQHGTQMSGIALYGCLTEVLGKAEPIVLGHALESIKILPPPNEKATAAPDWGYRTIDGVSKAHVHKKDRKRALCMPISADSIDMGAPTLWSAAVDSLCAGVIDESPKLMFVAVGNAESRTIFDPEFKYHDWNTKLGGIEDPSQAWNVVSVGAMTDKWNITEEELRGCTPIAQRGDLCPTSRTSVPWPKENKDEWPLKPDIVMEGGNYTFYNNCPTNTDSLSLLTTHLHREGRLLDATRDTSPASAAAARLGAIIWSKYPRLRPETVRALLIHSARWTPPMMSRYPGNLKSTVQQRLRCYGYGTPDLEWALNSAENNVTLIYEGELQPFMKDKSEIKTNEMHIHTLPWPVKALEDLANNEVTMRVTLSYFVEPSPGRTSWATNQSYRSHGLRFDVVRLPAETFDEFKTRVSSATWVKRRPPRKFGPDIRKWIVGDQGRTHGSIHSDWWVGKGVELAVCNKLAVYPVSGWWQHRPQHEGYEKTARYSLIISIEGPTLDTKLYSELTTQNEVVTEISM